MEKLTNRQNSILEFIRNQGQASTREIKKYQELKTGTLNRITIIRDLDVLITKKLIKKTGQGRSVSYSMIIENPLLSFYDIEKYFKQSIKERNSRKNFNFDIFKNFDNSIFSKEELSNLDKLNDTYRKSVARLSPTILKKEFERLTIELSWKSSQIEGNTYSLIETEILITENQEASGHTKSETQMILNHKKALDYIINNPKIFKELTLSKIEDLHKLLIFDLGVEKNIRKTSVGITGTNYKPLDNQFQIKEALHEMLSIINAKNLHPLLKALSAIALISYTQPFEDGNKRTARILGNAILLAQEYCPLSYRDVDKNDYKKAILLFYEQNSLYLLKEIFIQQFEFAVKNYFE
ncbi:MAG: Fic family protein [Candidatus Moraniibacteriota bacterium]